MGYAIHGLEKHCFGLFSEMIEMGFEPNKSTFVSILSACSITGNVDKGWKYFDLMKRGFGIDAEIEHYGCMLDLLGREGDFDRAKRFIEEMPLKPTKRIWGSLLSASRHHKNIELAELAAEKIFSLNDDDDNTGCYVLLSNLYAELGRWEDVERIKKLMKKRGLVKTAGFSTVEQNGKACNFVNYDKSKNESGVIYEVLDILSRKIGEEEVCSCNVTFKLPDLVKKRKDRPANHSVRLAVCFGLIGTAVGDPLVVRKNVRMCRDCHGAMKKISHVTNREIVVGDSKMWHRLKDDRCSCGDYW
ncbi:Pentatricopeptide repeat-containing protein -chloroplastic [Striga hermonthica]|uniref:Pentatricopeptide repeat-containing protein -chloroplastic n=1 Tax=Striga hermonthica TaxID=68872 RepID=A0A9N7MJL1_STRHE|nr:Pentatricopeptide repeat-containing protein -chloroplastic [Striga hermonthica]